jgi:hypothetical protein
VLSYRDTPRRPEQVYHAFVIGLRAGAPRSSGR